MAVTETTPYVSYIQDSQAKNHPIAAPYLLVNGATVSADQISAGVKYQVFTTLPTATASYVGTVGLVSDSSDVESGSYIEYICVNTGTSTTPTYSWENIGSTKIRVSVSDVGTAKDTVTVKYSKPNANTGNNTKTTISGSNFSFTGTAATITVPAHTHTMGGTTRYLKKTTYNTTSVIATLATTSINPAGSAVNVVTGYTNPTTAEFVTSYPGATANALSSSTSGKLVTASFEANTDAIKSYPGAFAKLTTASITPVGGTTSVLTGVAANGTANVVTSYPGQMTSIYPAANVNAVTSVTGTTATLASRVGSSVMNSATVSADGVLSFNSTSITGNVVSAVSTSTTNVRGTSTTVMTGLGTASTTSVLTGVKANGTATVATAGTAVTVATGATSATSVTTNVGAQIMTGLGTATNATKATITYATGATAATSVTTNVGAQVVTAVSGRTVLTGLGTAVKSSAITALGTAATASVATVGTAVTVVTGANSTASALTSSSSASVFTDVTTTSSGNQAFITTINSNTGEKAAVDIAYTPAGTISGTQDVPAHSHTIGTTSTDATVTVTGHTHTVTLSGGSVN